MSRDLSATVCFIKSAARNRAGYENQSQGVFLTPYHVLMTKHALMGAKIHTMLFSNLAGAETVHHTMIDGGRLLIDSANDLALLTLVDPIGMQLAGSVSLDTVTPSTPLTLATRHDFNARSFSVLRLPAMFDPPTREGYAASEYVGPGFSGSPLYDAQERLVTILTNSHPYDKEQNALLQGYKKASGYTRVFTAPSQSAVRRIVTQGLEGYVPPTPPKKTLFGWMARLVR